MDPATHTMRAVPITLVLYRMHSIDAGYCCRRRTFSGLRACTLSIPASPETTDEPIEMPFRRQNWQTRGREELCIKDRLRSWRIRLRDQCAAAMRPYGKLLRPLVCVRQLSSSARSAVCQSAYSSRTGLAFRPTHCAVGDSRSSIGLAVSCNRPL